MKVILINGSSKSTGNTYLALNQIEICLNNEGIETEILNIGPNPIRDCIGCGKCIDLGKCIFNDDVVNAWVEKMKNADGIVLGTPVYYAHASARIQALLDRMFYSNSKVFRHKVGACVAVARRAGNTSALDNLYKYLFINNMITVGSSYWNLAFGGDSGEILQDEEGLETMRNLGRNMAYVLKCIEAGRNEGINAPEIIKVARTNFIR